VTNFWGWLGGIFHSVVAIFAPLKNLKQWKIWNELWQLYLRVRKWLDWYRNNVHAHLQQLQALRRQIYNTFFLPILTIIDKIRRASQIVGLISPKLASKLNSIFIRIEDRILRPFQILATRFNAVAGVLRSMLTPLGYFDRATLLNSLWRDIRQLRELIRNPLRGVIPAAPAPPQTTTRQKVAQLDAFFLDGSGPLAASLTEKRRRMDDLMDNIR
jgi:hypothetical protein